MLRPHALQQRLKGLHISVDIAQRRVGHARAQRRPTGAQARDVSRQLDCRVNITIIVLGHPIRPTQRRHEARPHARDEVGARQRDHRHPHPQRLQAGGAAVVRRGVERDVDVAVLLHHVGQAARASENQPIGADALGREQRGKAGLHLGVFQRRRLEQQLSARQGLQHPRPQRDGSRRQLHRVVERAQAQHSAGLARRGQRVSVDRRPAKYAAGQLGDALAEQVAVLGRADHRVADQPVDRRQTGRVRVAQERGLHRRRAHREHAEPVGRGVAAQVDQQVDAVGDDGTLQRAVVQRSSLDPAVGAALGLAGVLVVHRPGVVDTDLEAGMVQPQQHRQHEDVDRVLAVQVASDQAQPQPPLGQLGVGKIGLALHGGLDRRAKTAVQRGDLGRGQRVLVQRSHRDARRQPRQRVAAGRVSRLQRRQVARSVAHPALQPGLEQPRIGVAGVDHPQPGQRGAAIG